MGDALISLRDIREEDIETLRLHRNDAATRVWLERNGVLSAEQQLRWFHGGGAASLRIAIADQVDVGLARLSHDVATRESLVGLDIFKPFRGRGLARPVFRRLCELSMAAGSRRLALWVFLENLPAIRVYRAEGFVPDENTPVKWIMRQFPHEGAPAPHAYVKMIR
ncbi:MAG: GNAT family N-acetyltransferase [Betaproteobacteria bacterium]|nr:GNAT family N-acetyltransferase [Betaproteobacteria bacterium]